MKKIVIACSAAAIAIGCFAPKQAVAGDGFAAGQHCNRRLPSCRSWELPLSNHPEIARDYIGNPGDVARKRSIGFTVFLQRHYKQIGLHRLDEIRGD